MSKSIPANAGAKPDASPPSTTPPPHPPLHPHDASRETVESIAFAFVLALMFRTFIAEAFVIPTGSMAPTLFGRNKDVVCSLCHYPYQVGASEELNDGGYLYQRFDDSICPNCRNKNRIRDLSVFKGDRILVNKFTYQIGDPDRWDVIVFRYPEDPQKNYIKRLVGLPGETIRISRGDVYARQGNQGDFQILRKQDPNKQKVLQQIVYDDRYAPREQLAKGWPERWSAMSRTDGTEALNGWGPDKTSWRQDPIARSFSIESSDDAKWIRYQHLVPERDDWPKSAGGNDPSEAHRPQLITDFCGYNSFSMDGGSNRDDDKFWVGDLTLNCTVDITSVKDANSELVLELVEGIRRYQCRINATTGQATLLRNDDLAADTNVIDVKMATAATPVRGSGKYRLTFANVDDRLCLWVNSSWRGSGLIPFGAGAEYLPPENKYPQQADLAPVGVAAKGVSAKVSDLIVERDIYYRAESVPNNDYRMKEDEVPDRLQLRERLDDPASYGDLYSRDSRYAEFQTLGGDEFFVLGDNSPRSQDSRLWSNMRHAKNRHAVPRQALLGKAFFIYWPHGIPFLNGGKGFNVLNHSVVTDQQRKPVVQTYPEYVMPFYPQWWRWKRIR